MALPGDRYQMAVGDQQVYDLFPLHCVRPELGLPHPGDDSPGGYAAVFLDCTFSRFSRSIVMVSLASRVIFSEAA